MAYLLDPNCGKYFSAWRGYVYFQAGDHGLYRVPCDGSAKSQQLDPNCGYLVVPGDGFVYFQAGDHGLYRVPCDGSTKSQQLDPNCGYLAVPGDGFVYFQAGGHGLYRVPCDGSAKSQQLDPNCGYLVVPDDGFVYFQAGDHGLYRVPCDGSKKSQQLDPNCGYLAVPGDGFVYFQAGYHGLYRVPCDGLNAAGKLDPNCGNLIVPGDDFVYFQGGPSKDSLYRVECYSKAKFPERFKMYIQDKYKVPTINVDSKRSAIEAQLSRASKDSSPNTWYINFTSGASTGAYPDAVADRINDWLNDKIIDKFTNPIKNRLGTIVMDFPNRFTTNLISNIFNYNFEAQSGVSRDPLSWMSGISETKRLSEITIPGTHESCAYQASPMSKCQNLNLIEQMEKGIRYLDIRCREINNKFAIHHGREYLNLNFDDVLTACSNFLEKNSTECIIMEVSEGYRPGPGNTKTFQEVFADYIANHGPNLWYLGNTFPAISEVRGKIFLLRRFVIDYETSNINNWGLDVTEWLIYDSTPFFVLPSKF